MKPFVLALLLAITSLPAQHPRFKERVDVARLMIDVRVVDGGGSAVVGLRAAEFPVRIDGLPARVESALWEVGSVSDGADQG